MRALTYIAWIMVLVCVYCFLAGLTLIPGPWDSERAKYLIYWGGGAFLGTFVATYCSWLGLRAPNNGIESYANWLWRRISSPTVCRVLIGVLASWIALYVIARILRYSND